MGVPANSLSSLGQSRHTTREIRMDNGRIVLSESLVLSHPTVRLTPQVLRIGCTTVTREAFEFLMAEAQKYWQDGEKVIQ